MKHIYAARDKNGKLYLYFGSEPVKGKDIWIDTDSGDYCESSDNIPSIRWEDERATEVCWKCNKLCVVKNQRKEIKS